MDRIDINGQIILENGTQDIKWEKDYIVNEVETNMISLSGACNIDNEKDIIIDIIEKTKNSKIFSGIIEIRNEHHFFIMIYNILNSKWDIQKKNFI